MKSILDPKFEYVPAVKTDIRKTFKRVRAELREKAYQQSLELARATVPVGKSFTIATPGHLDEPKRRRVA